MALHLKNPEADRLAHEVATLTGESLTTAVIAALRERRDRLQAESGEDRDARWAQATIAREAYRDFGLGRGLPARWNVGDCYAYALASDAGEPLLFKGDGFGHTDIAVADY